MKIRKPRKKEDPTIRRIKRKSRDLWAYVERATKELRRPR